MKPTASHLVKSQTKASSGIAGFDNITGGGLPLGRTTLLVGGPGSGKTIFALQFLVHGAQDCDEPGIFVAFEETSPRIVANAESFGWKLDELQEKSLYFMDAQPSPDLVQSGDFDLGGMLAALESQIKEMGARRILFDALDILLLLLPDQTAIRREIYRLHEWLSVHEMTGLITLKADGDQTSSISQQPFGFMHFMVDCAVILSHNVEFGVSQRSLRVQKYRGSSFDENESPFLIGDSGFEVVSQTLSRLDPKVNKERVSSGVQRLDTMLGGGYYRGASVLITGFSGTAKTTLSGAFAEAACLRGERTIFVCFDSNSSEVIRNLASVGIRLNDHVKSGYLRMFSARAITGSAETYLVRIKALAKAHKARCVVIDPVSARSKSGNDQMTQSVADRLIDWSKGEGTTLVCTSLLDEMSDQVESSSQLQISALVDTWIHLSYLVQAGERNRGLSIVKSRGMAHSNQVRELILSDAGVTLADTYTAGGEVLMGTLRWEKERAERVVHEAAEAAAKLKRVKLETEEADLEVRLKSLQAELSAKQIEKDLLVRDTLSHEGEISESLTRIQELRGADGETMAGENP
ncbi:circadian clock protein KaiC [Methylotuvimicrobium alcaliphilum]|uniref:non-specific serine/threonine protein kinase n=1 Tax=Methylotuvimicrobium alcaliphilum (strain DSM 19304 / NCIMB 14124 / VKM B-2133 / 20Z) TaxID=1091494 RepID=G4T093_META2|nr:circadian clock protein KaiC [Methylotuvimicrobium alcaliphilum]CCE23383.1 putative RecA-superfamily ATPase implicated in signal transduction [Methylotuvimicrobium alcaliphilum 20Z]